MRQLLDVRSPWAPVAAAAIIVVVVALAVVTITLIG